MSKIVCTFERKNMLNEMDLVERDNFKDKVVVTMVEEKDLLRICRVYFPTLISAFFKTLKTPQNARCHENFPETIRFFESFKTDNPNAFDGLLGRQLN